MTGIPLRPQIQLTIEEVDNGAQVGVTRRLHHLRKGRPEKWGARSADGWQRDIEGALAEQALAKYLGVPWDGGVLGVYDEKDVANCFQVRATSYTSGRLRLHPEDGDADIFILVTGTMGCYTVQGWCYGHEGKKTHWWADPSGQDRPAYFVPRASLRDVATLPPASTVDTSVPGALDCATL